MSSAKVGLDDCLLVMEKQNVDGVAFIQGMIAETPIYIPLADGANSFIERHSRVEATPEDVITVGAIKMNRSESECLTYIDTKVKGEARRRALKNDVNKRLGAIRKAQNQSKSSVPKASLDDAYAEYVELLQGAPYLIDEEGYLTRIVGRPPRQDSIRLANFVLVISKEIFVDDGNDDDSNRFVEVRGVMVGGIPLPPVTLPVSDFASARNLLSRYGTRLIIEPVAGAEDYIRHVAQILGKKAPRITKYNHTGWKKGKGCWLFLNAGKALGESDSKIEMAEGSKCFAAYRFPEGDFDAVQAVQKSLALLDIGPLGITLPLLAVCFMAVQLELFLQAEIPVGFCLFLVGDSGSYKSTLAALFLSHFGLFTKTNLPGSFVSTANALERLAFALKDVVMVIDDLYPTENPKERDAMTATLIRMVREFSNRSGRERCYADGSLRLSHPPRGIGIFTMELSVPGQSTNARGLEIVCKKDVIDLEKLTAAQANSDQLAFAMRGFIEYLAQHFDETVADIGNEFPAARALFSTDMAHAQLPDHLAAMHLGLKGYLDYAVQIGAIDESREAEILEDSRRVFHELGVHQSGEVKAESAVDVMDAILAELFASQKVYVKGTRGGPPPAAGQLGWSIQDEDEPVAPDRAELIGWADENFYYFLPQLFYTALSDFKAGLRQRFPVDLKALCVRLKDAGRLDTYHSEKRQYFTKKVHCENQQQTVIKIRRQKFEKPDEVTVVNAEMLQNEETAVDAVMPRMPQENQ